MKPGDAFSTQVGRYVDGIAEADEIARLNERLRADPEARRQFAELLNLDSALADHAAGWLGAGEDCPTELGPAARAAGRGARARWGAVAASVALLAGAFSGVWWWQASAETYATVSSTAGTTGLASGNVLHGEVHELDAGAVEVVTARGARLVIEAPAAFRFESARRLQLRRGRVAADVPPTAKGFTVVTPAGEAVDLGTRFGVDVPDTAAVEIHVFQGEVIARPKGGGQRQSLHKGEAVSLREGAGTSDRRDLRPAAFIEPEEMASLSAGLNLARRRDSDAALAGLRRDPALVALLDFESDELPPGTYRMVQGRWPGSRAPEFVNVGDHMKLDVGGDAAWPQLTLAAWVRLDRLGAPYQSLIHTDGWGQGKTGQVHWIITRNATMRLALFGNTLAAGSVERNGFPDSVTPVLPEQGRWVHLAVLYDSASKTVRFYRNGTFDNETRQEIAYPARLGPAQIGNWDRQDRKLSGRLDELIILGRAMSDDEVRALYAAGNPYR